MLNANLGLTREMPIQLKLLVKCLLYHDYVEVQEGTYTKKKTWHETGWEDIGSKSLIIKLIVLEDQ